MYRSTALREPRTTNLEMEGKECVQGSRDSIGHRGRVEMEAKVIGWGEEIRNLMDHGKESLAVLLVGTCSLGVSLTAL